MGVITISESKKENKGIKAKQEKKPRIVWIDILRGAMMFFVVWGHSTARGDIERYIFSFHMAAFFFISGLTFSFNKETDPLKYLLKKVRTLLVPYLLLNLYVTPLYYLNAQTGATKNIPVWKLFLGVLASNVDTGLPMASNTTWFITCLFLTDMLFFALWKLVKGDIQLAGAVLLTTTTAYAVGIIKRFPGGGLWHWQTAFTAVVFYMCGYFFMRNIEPVKRFLTEKKRRAYLIAAVLLADGLLLSQLNSRVSMVNDKYGNTLYFYLGAFSTTLAATFLVMLLSERGTFVRLMTPINFIGKTTLAYIALHVPLIKLLKHYTPFGRESEPYRLAMVVLLYIGLIPAAWLISKLLPKK